MTISFGKYKGELMENVPEDYLCWICSAFKGGTLATRAGEKPYQPPEAEFREARRILQERGYNVRGLWPVKD